MLQRLRAALDRLRRRSPAAPPAADEGALQEDALLRRALTGLVGAPVDDLALYAQALTHRSVLRGQPNSHLFSNERLEFLGDAVLGFVVGEHLYHTFPDQAEGFLTRLRAKLVNGQALAHAAEAGGLGALLRLSDNMDGAEGRGNASILADAFEAVIGAVYLDLGIDAARAFIHRLLLDEADLDDLAERHDNFKSLLLEYAQAHGWPQPVYNVTHEEGPSHAKTFTVEVIVQDAPRGEGTAPSKKKAEQAAARMALKRLRNEAAGA